MAEQAVAGEMMLTVFLKHRQSMNLAEINQKLEATGFWKKFPPDGVEVVSWYVMMGIGLVVTLKLPAEQLRAVNLAINDRPEVFLDAVRVVAGNEESIKAFRKCFHDREFFPGLGKPVTNMNETQLVQRAAELHHKLQSAYDPPEKWHAWPFLRVQFAKEIIDGLAYADVETRISKDTERTFNASNSRWRSKWRLATFRPAGSASVCETARSCRRPARTMP
jgi:hypothetical protein